MNQALDLDALTKATRRREFDDGLMDFVIGAGFFVLSMIAWFLFSPGGLRWYAHAVVNHRALTVFGLAILAVVVIIGPFAMRGGIERIRRHTIWRDSGFVKPLRRAVGWPTMVLSVVITLGMIVGAYWLMTLGRIGTEIVLRTLVASTGIGTGIIYFGMGSSLNLRRYLAIGLAGGALSASILFTPVSFSVAWLILGAIWIALLAVSGAWALRKTLLANAELSSE